MSETNTIGVSDGIFWRGKKLEDCTREDLIDAVIWLGERYGEFYDPKAIQAQALGQVEMMRRGNG